MEYSSNTHEVLPGCFKMQTHFGCRFNLQNYCLNDWENYHNACSCYCFIMPEFYSFHEICFINRSSCLKVFYLQNDTIMCTFFIQVYITLLIVISTYILQKFQSSVKSVRKPSMGRHQNPFIVKNASGRLRQSPNKRRMNLKTRRAWLGNCRSSPTNHSKAL